MAVFVADEELVAKLSSIIKEADDELILISPYIKLHSRIKDDLTFIKKTPHILITLVFGKNEEDLSKSISLEEIEFFMTFPNIVISYKNNLHAKYYANENNALITSMNLYSYSSNNNKEVGIYTKSPSMLKGLSGLAGEGIDECAYSYFSDLIETSVTIYENVPVTKKKLFGLSEEYVESKVGVDRIDEFFRKNKKPKGFCIRTGVLIPFNPVRPYSAEAYESWIKFKNQDYKEKFCHKTGKASNGKTSMRNPILQ